ncbi:MAG: YdiU family protein [Legionellales bacterium]|jgi:serine/tyrosine/threonine adenylyltransferase|nr:YdiU family protein [Legionellales bacterium]
MQLCGFNFDTTYTGLPSCFFTHNSPDLVIDPKLIILNSSLAQELGLDFENMSFDEQAKLFAGNVIPEHVKPFSQAYAGHQYGHFTFLGDGRAHILGEHVTPAGARFDIQFKGSGCTPYSRRGDGKAALGPMLREYIISEAMHHLGVPTTRSLAVVTTGEKIMRESLLPGAILTRVARSHIRVGSFEFASVSGGKNDIRSLVDYTVKRHYPEIIGGDNDALSLLNAVISNQAKLLVNWMRVGFIHGVMNTDNVSIVGDTIDYGPCAFLDSYKADTVFSSIDKDGRYAFSNQAKICQWNVAIFAETLLPLLDSNINKAVSVARDAIDDFFNIYQQSWLNMMCAKLGLFGFLNGDGALINDLLAWMSKHNADYTNTFYDLAHKDMPVGKIYEDDDFQDWYQRWSLRIKQNKCSWGKSQSMMRENNPAVIPRNHKVHEVLEAAAANNLAPLSNFLQVLQHPYNYDSTPNIYQLPPKPRECIYQTFCGT